MVALAPNTSETSSWDVLDGFPKLHSRAREVKTRTCTEALQSKSLGRVEIWQAIYDCRAGLESFTRDPIDYEGSEWGLYEYVKGMSLQSTDPSGNITVTTLSKDINEICGERSSAVWRFQLDAPAPCDGFIVQKVEVRCQIKDCPYLIGNCNADPFPQSPTISHWEAWPVKKGDKDFFQYDKWNKTDTGDVFSVMRTCGFMSAWGEVRFFCKSKTGDLMNSWKSNNETKGPSSCPITMTSGILPGTSTLPNWWNDQPVESVAMRRISTHWNCCCWNANSVSVTVSP